MIADPTLLHHGYRLTLAIGELAGVALVRADEEIREPGQRIYRTIEGREVCRVAEDTIIQSEEI
jgi:hypothetical protein